ncbi:carbohydrate kinase family protein [Rhodanobacter sp. B2A1Ga4]|uniref:carbohydrate kinase family protein n=1 Tax=Rhodanobacter TaxID=75309 RepID=UPI000D3B145B|nr:MULTISPECIES: carbohydrate kinase family protein [Rhodanobacter]MBQ4856369.1 carbohydrate kinase family protein [Rhodanobacter sp. B2A1Ga4]
MTRIAVLGYACLDYAASVDGDVRWGWTSRISSRPRDEWPRPGGCSFYVARPLAQAGFGVDIVTWTGDDAMGNLYADHCHRHGIGTQGIDASTGATTPVSMLLYKDDGRCACLIDFGSAGSATTSTQEDLIRKADMVVVTVGPAACGLRALDIARDDALIVWVAKNDPISFPPELRTRLGQRARYVFCNGDERTWIDDATVDADAEQIVVETRGAEPIHIRSRGTTMHIPVTPLQVGDATGAGDTLAGATLAALLGGETDPVAAVRSGALASSELLRRRT